MLSEISRDCGHSFQEQDHIPLLEDTALAVHGVKQGGELPHTDAQFIRQGLFILDAAGSAIAPPFFVWYCFCLFLSTGWVDAIIGP